MEEGPGVKAAVEATPKATEVAAEATTGEMPAAEAPATAEMPAATEMPATTEVPAATEMPAATGVPAAVAHANGVSNAAGKRERQENREPESRAGGQRSANRRELHAPSLVAARSPV